MPDELCSAGVPPALSGLNFDLKSEISNFEFRFSRFEFRSS